MKKLMAISLSAVIFASCSKDHSNSSCNITKENIVGSYKVTAVTYKAGPNTPEQDYFNEFFADACERDDVLTFRADGTLLLEDAGAKCSPDGSNDANWELFGDRIVMFDIGPSSDEDAARITDFDCKTKMVLVYQDYDVDHDQLKLTLTRQ